MREFVSTITSKGQITIPAEIRKKPQLNKGDKLSFAITEEGAIELRVPAHPTIASLAGAAGSLEEPMEWEDMRDLAREDRLVNHASVGT